MSIRLILIEEKEISAVDCWYCGQPFDLDYRNTVNAIEVEGGEFYLHKSCAKELAERLTKLAK